MQPGGRELCAGRVEPVEVDEDLLGHVLGLVRISQDPVGYAGHPRVFTFEQRLEGLFARFHQMLRGLSEIYAH